MQEHARLFEALIDVVAVRPKKELGVDASKV